MKINLILVHDKRGIRVAIASCHQFLPISHHHKKNTSKIIVTATATTITGKKKKKMLRESIPKRFFQKKYFTCSEKLFWELISMFRIIHFEKYYTRFRCYVLKICSEKCVPKILFWKSHFENFVLDILFRKRYSENSGIHNPILKMDGCRKQYPRLVQNYLNEESVRPGEGLGQGTFLSGPSHNEHVLATHH